MLFTGPPNTGTFSVPIPTPHTMTTLSTNLFQPHSIKAIKTSGKSNKITRNIEDHSEISTTVLMELSLKPATTLLTRCIHLKPETLYIETKLTSQDIKPNFLNLNRTTKTQLIKPL